MKTTLKPSRSVGANLDRRSAPPTVRFLDPEPMPRRLTGPGKTVSLKSPSTESYPDRPGYSRGESTPDLGPHQYRQKKIMIATLTRPPLLSSASKRASTAASPGDQAGSPRTLSFTQPTQGRPSGPVVQLRRRVDKRFSAPAVPSHFDPRLDPRWSGIPLPAGFVPPSRTSIPTQRTTSYHSVVSNLSSSPPPSVTVTPSDKYDPLQNYIPCMAAMCSAHYTPAHSGPTYYTAQEPYHLSKYHGYCPRHASKEMQEANALCKKEYETMRQNAGRKTLGVVAQDFEIFLQLYREARQVEDARLQKAQNLRVLGSSHTPTPKGKATPNYAFDWRYTLRNCTKRGCTSAPYSPLSIQYFGFYNTPNSSTQLLPLTTLCPSCSKAEAEGFGAKLMEKWSSRCGWDGEEWDGWYRNAILARKKEHGFWENAQERVVRERLVKKAMGMAVEVAAPVEREMEGEQTEVTPKNEKRKSIFRRMFRRSETTGATAVAITAGAA
ncbi:uncharacterized protein M421DRAFT_5175 [Didymella exigua CBS 183.55]|uniref:Uncharacterized protein n=1 Tax=Didymella exigua CBS 183.55 TaxID=1150837 RepID=A0A6A5RM49_9PLEO|nr:uncharacterized protein M421DRAFT_5175 [Didymella exigua CBS 183.55]KAF1928729.1 hypothetical protein M421DRAFT_5175 [Didymella exigua CBS 183.55]